MKRSETIENDLSLNTSSLITLNFEVFKKEILNDNEMVLVAFVADWSGPSQILDQIFNKLDGKVRNRIKILKIDVARNKKLAERFNVQNFPTLIFFKKGEIKEVITGFVSNKLLTSRLDSLLNKEETQG
ncbi:MAG: thioredoxin fold domain-containing protein [candidate division Zixibacteria bacterium]|nr:thioredoxin fold domain-containing protein [candidate division Zixibacteria bacterium]